MNDSELDEILTLQLAFAWAGEGASDPEDCRLGWWKTDLLSEYGGLAVLQRLTPRTYEWAALEAAREAARRVDEQKRTSDADADKLVSLFHLGHPTDEELDDRLKALKSGQVPPKKALPRLQALLDTKEWNPKAFVEWLEPAKAPKHKPELAGLRITTKPPKDPVERATALAAILATLPEQYPCAHYRDDATG